MNYDVSVSFSCDYILRDLLFRKKPRLLLGDKVLNVDSILLDYHNFLMRLISQTSLTGFLNKAAPPKKTDILKLSLRNIFTIC